jgi:hypothetical protein
MAVSAGDRLAHPDAIATGNGVVEKLRTGVLAGYVLDLASQPLVAFRIFLLGAVLSLSIGTGLR